MKKLLSTVLCLGVLAGCTATPLQTSGGSTSDKTISPAGSVGQSALPPGATFKPEGSLIIGSGDQWVGRLV
ncbi:MAG: hypothetical protein FJX66_15465, partial [Alphaproteobacteria bacterium]|nr:hypothetical protein [Alphaproteobacteria bacterium]